MRYLALLFMVQVAAPVISGCSNEDTTPPSDVLDFAAAPGDSQVELTWTNPEGNNRDGVVIVRSDAEYPASRGDGTLVYEGNGQSFADVDVKNNTTYFYTAFAYNKTRNYASGVRAVATPTALTGEYNAHRDLDRIEQLILDASDDELSEEMKQSLMDKLHQAREAYQKGDICGTSLAMREFAELAQGYREDASLAFIDELFSRGRMVRYDMIAELGENLQCPGDERVGVNAATTLDSDASDNTRVVAKMSFGEPRLTALDIEEGGFDEVFTEVRVPGSATISGDDGKPAVPILRKIIAAPRGAQVTITYQTSVAETFRVNLVPNQPQPVDDEPVDPDLFEDKAFVRDDGIYNTDALYPASPARVIPMGQYRDLPMFMVEIAAGQYNPQSDDLTLFDEVDFEITFVSDSDAAGAFVTEASTSPFESAPSSYVGPVLNGEDVFEYTEPREELATIDGEELLILTHPSFLEPANDLAEWKRTKGIVTNVVVVNDDDDPSSPKTPEEIDALIEDRYDNAFIRMSYILLMGDSDFIPTFQVEANEDPFDLGSDTIASDLPYAVYRAANHDDMLPDFAVGRIPVEGFDDATIVVNKIINYESTPPTESRFYQNAGIAAQFECCRRSADSGTAKRSFTETSEFIRDVLLRNGYAVDRIYERTGDSIPERYRDGTLLPRELRPGNGFAWDGATADIIGAINDGRFLFIHRDHGGKYSWEHPYFTTTNIEEDLANGALLPVVFSVNCATGWFDYHSSRPVFVEALLRHPGGGAVGVLGDTRNSPTWANSALAKGFIDATWPEAIPDFGDGTSKRRLGDILNHGKLYMLTQVGVPGTDVQAPDAQDEMYMWHVYGDPTLEIWTENPDPTALSGSASAIMGGSALEFVYGTEGATVTAHQGSLSAGTTTIGRGEVIGGVAEIPFINPPDEEEEIGFSVTLPGAVSELIVLSVAPPENVGGFSAVADETQIELTWTNPEDAEFEGVKIQRLETGFPASADMGTTVYDGASESYTDTGLTYGVTYYYTAFAYDDDLNYSSGAPASARPNYSTPQTDVTNLTGRSVVGNQILTWTNPTNSEFAGVRIVRTRFDYATSPEADTLIYDGPLETYSDDIPCPSRRTYVYAVFAYDDLANFSGGQGVAVHCFSAAPPGGVTDFTAEAGDTELVLSWTNPADASFDGVMLIRTTDGAATNPDDFIEFSDAPADPDGGAGPQGVQVYDGADQMFTDTGLTNEVTYYYTAYTYDADNNWGTGVEISATPVVDVVAPGNVTGMTAEPGDESVSLSWTNPGDSDFTGVRVMRATGAYPSSPTEGTQVYDGTGESTLDTGLTNGVAYFYTVFAYDEVPNYATGTQATATPADIYPPANVGGLGCNSDGQSLTLSWSTPTDADFAGVRIQRSATDYPSSPTDGVTVADAMINQFIDSNVSGLAYYTVFSYDEIPNYSSGAQISCTVE